jgi:DNA-binding CsgD family transcriptional regulator/tetratricopeptide (TPR) repeat protein
MRPQLPAALASHREAAAQFERALRFADPADPATVAGLYDGFAYEASLLDRWQEAADARMRALTLWREVGNRLREGDTLRWIAASLCSLTRGDAGIAAARDAIALLEPLGRTAELAWAYATLASMWMMRGVNQDAIELARRAQAIAWPLGLTRLLSNALNTEACAVHATGGEWADALRQSLDIALTGRHEAEVARAYVNLHACYVADRDWATAERYFTPGIAYCGEHDITSYSMYLHSERTSVLERTGRWDEAVALCRELLHQGGPSPSLRLCPLHRLGTILARRGEPGAWECLDEGIGYADGSGEPQSIVPLRLARAEAFWLEGKLPEARREAELADAVAGGCDSWEQGAVAVWLRRTGSARPPRGEPALPYQLQLDGDRAGAARLWTELGCPYEAALALLGSADEASLRKALWTFIDLGALATVRLTRQKMRRLAIRSIPAGPRTATRMHPLGLTRREREVLELICARHTNAEIAQKLFISVKTVDHHVSAVLAKLGAPTRRAAATRAAKLGLIKTASLAAEPPHDARLRPRQGRPAGGAGRRPGGPAARGSARQGDQVELPQRAGVAEQVDRGDLPAGEGEGEDHPRPPAGCPHRPGDPVDERELGGPGAPEEHGGHGVHAADLRLGAGPDDGLVGPDHHVRVQHCDQRAEVAVARGGEEGLHDLAPPGQVSVGGGVRSLDPPAGTGGQLPGRGGGAFHDRRDLLEGHREHVVQDERQPLRRGQRVQHHEQGQADRVGQHGLVLRPGALRATGDLLRQVRARGILAPRLAGLQHVQRHPGHHRGQPPAQVRHLAGVRAGQPQPGLLDGVVRVADRAQDSVGHRPQVGAVLLEPLRQPVVGFHRSHTSVTGCHTK